MQNIMAIPNAESRYCAISKGASIGNTMYMINTKSHTIS
jgi:hypothetical protein